MKIIVKESKMEMVVSKFIDTLTGDLTKIDSTGGFYWVNGDGDTIFIYDNYYRILEIDTELISNIIKMLGIQYKDLKKLILPVLEEKLNIDVVSTKFF